MGSHRTRIPVFVLLAVGWFAASAVQAQCVTEPRLDNFTGAGEVVCPCFVTGEQAGAVFDLPPGEFPIEIVKVGIGWGSQSGGNPDQLEEAIKIYEGGLPNPGAPIFTVEGPVLTDGVINEFDIGILPGEAIINSGPFTVTLQFLEQSTLFGPSVIHDGNGCQLGRNAIFAIPGGWNDACLLGVSGDWVFYVFYRKLDCGPGGAPGSVPNLLLGRAGGTQLTLSWDTSCSVSDNDYQVYQGFMGAYYSHFSTLCTTGGATSVVLTPGVLDRYFLVVPTDTTQEGSYGRDSSGVERPQGGAACQAQQTIACP
jgi:hypothetical protein